MANWKPIAAGSGIATLVLLAIVLVGHQNGAASANPKEPIPSSRSSSWRPEIVTIPAGTRIHIRLENAFSADKNSSGDRFAASLDGSLMAGSKVLAPSQSKLLGHLTRTKEPGWGKGRARLTMMLQKLTVDGKEYDLKTHPLTLVARNTVTRDPEEIGGAAGGTLNVAIKGGNNGVAIGAGAGGNSGTGYLLATKGPPNAYGPELHFAFTLSRPLELPVYRK